MTDHKSPSPYKGVPKSQWAEVKERARQHAAALAANAKPAPQPAAPPQTVHVTIDNGPATIAPESPLSRPPLVMRDDVIASALEAARPAPEPKINSEVAPKAPPRNLFSGQFRTLDVFGKNGSHKDPIPGWRLYWMNDIGDRINQARMSGWEFVEKDEIALQENVTPGNNDLGTHVRKVVNPNLIPPTYAYLMKKPAELDAQHQAEMQEVNNRAEAALKQGRTNAQPGDGRYVAGDFPNSALPQIEISQKTFRRPTSS